MLNTMVINLLFISVVVLLALSLVRFLRRVWWDPIRIKKMMEAQGIRGPQYKFLHGNAREAEAMVKEARSKPMELSHTIAPRVEPYLHAWVKEYGGNFLKWHGPLPELIISEPELIKEVLCNREGAYTKIPTTRFLQKLLGDGLVTAEGKKWVRQRKLANHSFHAENLKVMIPAIVISVEDMLKKWVEYENKEVDLFQEFRVLSSDFISRTAFGSTYMQGKDIFTKLGDLARIISRNAETVRFPFMRNNDDKKADKIEKEIRDIIIKQIMKRRDSNRIGCPDGYGSDLLGLLVKANYENERDERISLEDIIDECKTFYFAGHETTTGLLTWTSLLLAINTDWQEKARKEATELFGGRPPTSDDTNLTRLKTMTMILNESLRLYPPVVLLTRKVAKEVRLGKLVLPAGLALAMSPLIIQHDPQLWGEDAHLFKPERFADGVAGATNNRMCFLPFGLGPRFCVGQGLAIMETKIALSMILQNYTFTLSPGYVHAPIKELTTRPQYGLQVILQRL